MSLSGLAKHTEGLGQQAQDLAQQLEHLQHALEVHASLVTTPTLPFLSGLTIFVLAIFVGYYVIWRVTPALHSPLMSITNAISSVIIVGAILATGIIDTAGPTKWLGFLAVVLSSINIFGGFFVTQRMLQMFTRRQPALSPSPPPET